MARTIRPRDRRPSEPPPSSPGDLSGGPPLRALWQAALAAALLYVLLVIFFREIVLLGRVFTGSGDTVAAVIFEQWGRELLARGVFPLWNPFLFAGMPSFGSLQFTPGVYPVEWLRPLFRALFFGGASSAIFFHHLLGGLFMYLLLRDLQVEKMFSFFGALVFCFTPQLMVLGPVAHGGKLYTITWLPLVLLMTRRVLGSPDLLRTALLAVVVALMLLALHMQIAYYGLMVMAVAWGVDTFRHRRDRARPDHLRRLGALAAAGIMALGLAAYLLWPVYEYSGYSIRGGTAIGGGLGWDYATMWSLHPVEMLTFLVPSWFGFGGATYWGYMPFTDHPYYMGVVPLLLAIAAVVLLRRRPDVQVLGIIALLALLVSFGNWVPLLYGPLFQLLPFFGKFRIPAMILVLLVLAVAALAALGAQALLGLGEPDRGRWARRMLYAAGACALVGVVAMVGGAVLEGNYVPAAMRRLAAAGAGADAAGRAREAFALFRWDLVRVALLAALALGALYLGLAGRLKGSIAAAAVIVLTGADLWVVNSRLVTTEPRVAGTRQLEPNPFTEYLAARPEPFRILNRGLAVPGNYWMAHRIEDAEGYSPAKLGLYQDLYDVSLQGGRAHPTVLRMLNVRYVLAQAGLEVEWLRESFTHQGVSIYTHPEALGPAWLVGEVVTLPREQEVLEALLRGPDPGRVALMVEDPGPLDREAATAGSVTLLERDPHHLRYRVEVAGPVLLAVSEVWYPAGWKAEVNGRRVPIHRINYLLRGIYLEGVPGGEAQEVSLRFEPASVRLGRRLSIAMLLLTVGVGGFGRLAVRRRRPRPPAPPENPPA